MNKIIKALQKVLQKLLIVRYMNRWVVFLVDLFISVLSTCLVTYVVLTFQHLNFRAASLIQIIVVSTVASFFSLRLFRLYASVIRHSTLTEVWRILSVSLLKVLIILIAYNCFIFDYNIRLLSFITMIDFFVTMVALVTFRIMLLNIYKFVLVGTYKRKNLVLIYGTGSDSVALVGNKKILSFERKNQIKGFITLNDEKKHYRIMDLPVYCASDVDDFKVLVTKQDIDAVLFPTKETLMLEENRLVKFCSELNIKRLLSPQVEEYREGIPAESNRVVREVKIEDLLGRDEIIINMQEIANLLENKVVLVTGAAGSIGSEICRQLAKFNLKHLVCFDNAETPMHNLRLELEEKYPLLKFTPVIGDVRSKQRINSVFDKFHPQVVFHAAAYKHVPLMEENPCEAIRVNVFGTRNVADIAVERGVERFVMVSTDKAVNPTNIMGCSKRLAEIYVQSLSLELDKKGNHSTRFITTRFGNVLGSNGSVIPRFRDQIIKGGPVTVTDPGIIRYFMTIPEACRLVLEAGTMGNGGEIFVFDMGKPVKIDSLARNMIKLAGFVPDEDIEIKYTGLRPGEKLYEELLSNKENTKPTPHEKINVAAVRQYKYAEVVEHIDKLIVFSKEVKVPDMVKEMKAFVPEFVSNNSIYEKYDCNKK